MNRIQWIEPYYDVILNIVPRDAKTIIDVGAGSGIFGYILKQTRKATLTAVEPFSYELSHYDVVIYERWQDIQPVKHDVLVSLEMIEHMPRYDAIQFLNKAKTVADKVIIATPFTFEQQPAYDDNQYQIHKSLITIQDFKNAGYKVRLVGTFNTRLFQVRIVLHPKIISVSKLFGIKITNIIGVC